MERGAAEGRRSLRVTRASDSTESDGDDRVRVVKRRGSHIVKVQNQKDRVPGIGVTTSSVCSCQRSDPFCEHFAVPCTDGRGGCRGWVHPQCVAMPATLWAAHAVASAEGATPDVPAPQPYVCPLCIHLAASAGELRASMRSLLPPPLTHPAFVVEKILGHRMRPHTTASSAALLQYSSVPASAAADSSARALPHVEGHSHLFTAHGSIESFAVSQALPTTTSTLVPLSLRDYEYLCKWKGRSYMHCSWETVESLVDLEDVFLNSLNYDARTGQGAGGSREVCSARIQSRIERYRRRCFDSSGSFASAQIFCDDDGASAEEVKQEAAHELSSASHGLLLASDSYDREWFDPEYTYPERILRATVPLGEDSFDTDASVVALRSKVSAIAAAAAASAAASPHELAFAAAVDLVLQPRYLVKWRGLPYNECTWESGADVGDDDLLREFRLRETLPDDCVLVQMWAREDRLADAAWRLKIAQWCMSGSRKASVRKSCCVSQALLPSGSSVVSVCSTSQHSSAAAESEDWGQDDGEAEVGPSSSSQPQLPVVQGGLQDSCESSVDITAISVPLAPLLRDDDDAYAAVGPSRYAHLLPIFPRLGLPPPTHFEKVMRSPTYGVPWQLTRADLNSSSNSGTAAESTSDATLGGLTLHPYQVEGLNWLLFNLLQNRSSLLCDEMGLGKTAQTIALLMQLQTHRVGCFKQHNTRAVLRVEPSGSVESASSSSSFHGPQVSAMPESSVPQPIPPASATPVPETALPAEFNQNASTLGHRRGPFLIIAPLSTLGHWARELATWTIGAGAAVRQSLLQSSMSFDTAATAPPGCTGDCIRPRSEIDSLSRFPAGALTSLPMNTLVYHGSAASRAAMRELEWFFEDPSTGVQLRSPLPLPPQSLTRRAEEAQKALLGNASGLRWLPCYKFDLLLTTYETVMQDAAMLSSIPWAGVVVDEAHRLKNSNSKLFLELKTWPRDFSILLTGTPIQNTVEELWALLHFVEPRLFVDGPIAAFRSRKAPEEPSLAITTKAAFLEEYGDMRTSEQVSKLRRVLKPYLLRRLKVDVHKTLPPKAETVIEIEMTAVQKQYYRAIYERNAEFLVGSGAQAQGPSLMNIVMELRKVCNHPYLLRGVEDALVSRAIASLSETAASDSATTNAAAQQRDISHFVNEQLVNVSGKFQLLDKLLPRLHAGGHRVLIFSQMVRALDLIADYATLRGFTYERLDGRIRGPLRQAAIDRFSHPDSDCFLMLLSTRAGGLGINLTAADTVILFDSDWNPQSDLQAQARVHRIGQKRVVKIYRLLTRKSYEQVLFASASLKLGLDKAVIRDMHSLGARNARSGALGSTIFGGAATGAQDDSEGIGGGGKSSLSAKEIEHLLKRGAYEVFREGEEEAEAAHRSFTSEGIDSILSRSTTLRYDDGCTAEAKTASADSDAAAFHSVFQAGSFSKASFVAAGDGTEVDIDDPEFWRKAVGLKAPANPPPAPLSEPLHAVRRTPAVEGAHALDDDAGAGGVDDEDFGQMDEGCSDFGDTGAGEPAYHPSGSRRPRGSSKNTLPRDLAAKELRDNSRCINICENVIRHIVHVLERQQVADERRIAKATGVPRKPRGPSGGLGPGRKRKFAAMKAGVVEAAATGGDMIDEGRCSDTPCTAGHKRKAQGAASSSCVDDLQPTATDDGNGLNLRIATRAVPVRGMRVVSKPWTPVELRKIMMPLRTFGWGRWNRILADSGLSDTRSVAELRVFVRVLMQATLDAAAAYLWPYAAAWAVAVGADVVPDSSSGLQATLSSACPLDDDDIAGDFGSVCPASLLDRRMRMLRARLVALARFHAAAEATSPPVPQEVIDNMALFQSHELHDRLYRDGAPVRLPDGPVAAWPAAASVESDACGLALSSPAVRLLDALQEVSTVNDLVSAAAALHYAMASARGTYWQWYPSPAAGNETLLHTWLPRAVRKRAPKGEGAVIGKSLKSKKGRAVREATAAATKEGLLHFVASSAARDDPLALQPRQLVTALQLAEQAGYWLPAPAPAAPFPPSKPLTVVLLPGVPAVLPCDELMIDAVPVAELLRHLPMPSFLSLAPSHFGNRQLPWWNASILAPAARQNVVEASVASAVPMVIPLPSPLPALPLEDDRALILGVFKHGLLSHEAILLDRSLGFRSKLQLLYSALPPSQRVGSLLRLRSFLGHPVQVFEDTPGAAWIARFLGGEVRISPATSTAPAQRFITCDPRVAIALGARVTVLDPGDGDSDLAARLRMLLLVRDPAHTLGDNLRRICAALRREAAPGLTVPCQWALAYAMSVRGGADYANAQAASDVACNRAAGDPGATLPGVFSLPMATSALPAAVFGPAAAPMLASGELQAAVLSQAGAGSGSIAANRVLDPRDTAIVAPSLECIAVTMKLLGLALSNGACTLQAECVVPPAATSTSALLDGGDVFAGLALAADLQPVPSPFLGSTVSKSESAIKSETCDVMSTVTPSVSGGANDVQPVLSNSRATSGPSGAATPAAAIELGCLAPYLKNTWTARKMAHANAKSDPIADGEDDNSGSGAGKARAAHIGRAKGTSRVRFREADIPPVLGVTDDPLATERYVSDFLTASSLAGVPLSRPDQQRLRMCAGAVDTVIKSIERGVRKEADVERREIEDALESVVRNIEVEARESDVRLRACAQVLDAMLRKIAVSASHSGPLGRGGSAGGRVGSRPDDPTGAPSTTTALERSGLVCGASVHRFGAATVAALPRPTTLELVIPADVVVTLPMFVGAKALAVRSQLGVRASALYHLAGSGDVRGPAAAAAVALVPPEAASLPTLLATAEVSLFGHVRDLVTSRTFALLEDWVSDVARREVAPAAATLQRSLAYDAVLLLPIQNPAPMTLNDLRPAYARKLCVAASALQSSPERLLLWHAESCAHEGRAVDLPTSAAVSADVAVVSALKRKRPVVVVRSSLPPSHASAVALGGSLVSGIALPQQTVAGAAGTANAASAAAAGGSWMGGGLSGGRPPPVGASGGGIIPGPSPLYSAAMVAAHRRAKQQQQLQQLQQGQLRAPLPQQRTAARPTGSVPVAAGRRAAAAAITAATAAAAAAPASSPSTSAAAAAALPFEELEASL